MSVDFKKKVATSALWMTLSNSIISSLSIISTLILARILTPNDFGLVATATIVTGFFDLFSKLGTMQYLINKTNPLKEDINTAFTIQFISQLFIALFILLSANFTAQYFNDPRLESILLVLAIIPLLIGAKNVGLVLLQKNMEFKRIMVMQSASKIISFITLLAVAYIYRSYWAFIIGMVVHHLCALIISYIISNYRPRFCLLKIKEQFSFSSWVLLKGFINYAGNKADAFLISKYLSVTNVGFFNLGTRIATIPNDFLLKPFDNVIYSGLAESLNNQQLFNERCLKTLLFIIFITIPLCAITILGAPQIVTIFLGDNEKWSMVTEILPYLSVQIVLLPVWNRLYDFITLIGKVKRVFLIDCVYATISITALTITIIYSPELINIVMVGVVVRFIFIFYLTYICKQLVDLKILRLVNFIIPTLLSACLAAWLTLSINLNFDNSLIQLIITSSLFMILHLLVVITVMWLLKKVNKDYETLIELILTFVKKQKSKLA